MILPNRLQAAILYIQLRGRLDDVPADVVQFIRGNLSTDDRLHLWAFILGRTGV